MKYRGKQILTFDPAHFLGEAISDFLESGAQPNKIASAVIKVATGVELLLKGKLEKICPALILERIDDSGLQVAKAFNLTKHLRNPKELDNVDMKTASFTTLLNRASKFIDLGTAKQHLEALQKIRNSLVHHKGEVDMWQTNLLLVKHVFPFLEELGKTDPRFQLHIGTENWKKIKQVERLSSDAFTSQLAKKLQHHCARAEKLLQRDIRKRIASEPDASGSEIIDKTLICPACRKPSLTAFGDVDVDVQEGVLCSAGWYTTMGCRVCELELDTSEAEHIHDEYEEFFGVKTDRNKEAWGASLEGPELTEYY